MEVKLIISEVNYLTKKDLGDFVQIKGGITKGILRQWEIISTPFGLMMCTGIVGGKCILESNDDFSGTPKKTDEIIGIVLREVGE